ncbi:hypothetical protein [Mycolicibacterium xanthum]|nr:hypothetical protein [Mycolicibacterium xanthum]
MIVELQYLAVAVFLLWGLASALCEVFQPEDTEEPAETAGPGRD